MSGRDRPPGSGTSRDTVFVEGLEVRLVIGVHPEERTAPRPLSIDVELACDASRPAAGDDLTLAINYDAVAKAVVRHAAAQAPQLLETLAEGLAAHLLSAFHSPWVRLRITKPGVVPGARAVGLVVERGSRGTT